MHHKQSRLKRAQLTRLKPFLALCAFSATSALLGQNERPVAAKALETKDFVGPFISQALRGNPGLAAYDKRYLSAHQSITASAALPNPKIQITHFVESVQTRTGPQNQALMLQQPIPWLGKLSSKRDIARAQATTLWHAYAVQQFKLIDQVAHQTLELAYLHKSTTATQRNIELLNQLENVVEEKVKAGGELADLLRLQVEIEGQKDYYARQTTQKIVATSTLQSLTGESPNGKQVTIDWQPPTASTANPTKWIQSIRERSPQLAILRSIENSQTSRERMARFASRPDFSVGLNYINTGDSQTSDTLHSGKDPWAIIVGVSLPIWSKANNALSLQASLEKEAVSAQIQELELKLLADAQSWIARLNDADARVQRYDTKLIPLARQALEITESSYRTGKAGILDLIDSERVLLKLETEYWRAAANAWLAHWKLATLSGGLWLN